MMYGFQSGMSGSTSRVYCRKGTNTRAESINSKFDPSTGTPVGAELDQGAELQSRSAPDSVRPGNSPGATNVSASSPYTAAAATAGRIPHRRLSRLVASTLTPTYWMV